MYIPMGLQVRTLVTHTNCIMLWGRTT